MENKQIKKNKVNTHRTCKTIQEYLNAIVNEGYLYTIEDLAELLDMKEQYIQVNYIKRLNTLYIEPEKKSEIRKLINVYQIFKKPLSVSNFNNDAREVFSLIKELIKNKEILRKKILIQEDSIDKLITDIFKKEVKSNEMDNKCKKLVPLTDEDINYIYNNQLRSTKSLKEYFDVKHDVQMYRNLKYTKYIKYVCEDPSKKANRVRYLLL
ncbi:hypothetical protein PN290_14435 [Romboutsia sp. 1001216sp1]|uniref:hypothetical protein n=1 Tax=unclassified Romboutsia TaxID=2626894 RepID=UPI0018AB4D50|nr:MULTISPECIES: hypothetical protein [unclassified Romboutsia]MDB8794903.1 hypothetical protein [Romboutsia sp. 1001216sp1]MDB8797732.1 hypothetical protein [Romboutsia sp. 1001216sp1]MDB8800553.1 hypothetical protein [Romboutsia sp. 1001216sp1]